MDNVHIWTLVDYAQSNESTADAIISEWINSGEDPDAGGVWFALPHVYEAKQSSDAPEKKRGSRQDGFRCSDTHHVIQLGDGFRKCSTHPTRWLSRNDRPPNKDAIDCNAIAKDQIEGKIVFRMIYK